MLDGFDPYLAHHAASFGLSKSSQLFPAVSGLLGSTQHGS